MYNPRKQLIDHDPRGNFVKQWVDELSGRTFSEIAEVEKVLPRSYPSPLINLAEKSKIMKDRIFKIRRSSEGKHETELTLHRHGSKARHKPQVKQSNQLLLF